MLLQAYQESWAYTFERIACVLMRALDGLAVGVEHVGSTAVPGLAAKPILDIDLVYPPGVTVAAVTARLEPLGYRHVGNQGILSREVFKRPVAGTAHGVLDLIPHHLYACSEQGEELRRHLLFRDFLRSNETARQQYQDLKACLAEEAGHDQKKYATLKQARARAFVAEVLTQAARREARTAEAAGNGDFCSG